MTERQGSTATEAAADTSVAAGSVDQVEMTEPANDEAPSPAYERLLEALRAVYPPAAAPEADALAQFMFGFLDVLDRHAAERKRLRHEQKQRATELCRRYLLVTNSTLACTRRRRRPRRRVFGWRTGTAVLARQAWWDQCEEECAAGISPYRGTKKREVGR